MTTDVSKCKSVEDFPSSEVFADLEAASGYIEAISGHAAKLKIPVHIQGVKFDKDGNAEQVEEWPTDSEGTPFNVDVTRIQYKTVIGKDETTGEDVNGWRTKAIVAYALPSFDQLLADKAGRDMIVAAASREVRARAIRALRAAETAEEIKGCVDNMPKSIAELAASSRTATGGAYGAFNSVWQTILQFFESKVKALAAIRIKKEDLRQALSNAAYARAMFPALEELGLFTKMLAMMIAKATQDGLDTTTLQRWMDERDEQSYEEADVNLDDLGLDDLLAAKAEAEAPAAE